MVRLILGGVALAGATALAVRHWNHKSKEVSNTWVDEAQALKDKAVANRMAILTTAIEVLLILTSMKNRAKVVR